MNGQRYIITTYNESQSPLGSQLWNSREPLALGFPFRWIIEKTKTGLRIRDLKLTTVRELSDIHLQHNSITLTDGLRVHIHVARVADAQGYSVQNWIETRSPDSTHEWELFKKVFIGCLACLLGLIVASFLLPKPQQKQDELIPPQFAKIIMNPAFKKAQTLTQHSNTAESDTKGGNLVQAFQSKAVRSSTQNLFKGGLINHLATSHLISDGSTLVAVNSLFNSDPKSKNTMNFGPNQINKVAVATFGSGRGQAGPGNLGYGSGVKAGLGGQGSSFVSLDTSESRVEEGLSKDEVGKVIHSHITEVRYCYEAAMVRNPEIQGKLIVDFTIAATGAVQSAKINSSTLADPTLDHCILTRLLSWKFPKTKGGVTVSVTYPFILKSIGR